MLKPARGTLLNLSHPHAHKVRANWLCNEGGGGTIFDSARNGNVGRLLSAGQFWVKGPTGPAIDYNGISGLAIITSPKQLTFSDGISQDRPFTIFALVKMDDTTRFRVISKGQGATNAEWALFTTGSSSLRFQLLHDGTSKSIFVDTASLAAFAGKWCYFVGTYSGNSLNTGMEVYAIPFDPGPIFSTNTRGAVGSYVRMTNSGTAVRIANLWGGGTVNEHADGQISDVFITNKYMFFSEVMRVVLNPYAMFERSISPRIFVPPVVGAIMNQFQGPDVGANLFDGPLM